jgi:hypothetical protein
MSTTRTFVCSVNTFLKNLLEKILGDYIRLRETFVRPAYVSSVGC